MITLRTTLLVFAMAITAPVIVYAQTSGMPSSTSPSNSEGTPSGGTGVLNTTRVGPTAKPVVSRSRARHRRHRAHRSTT